MYPDSPMTDPVPVQHDPDRQRLSLRVEGHEAELTYHLLEAGTAVPVMVIDHTGVPEAIGGRGLAGRLVEAAFELARSRGWKVLPACSYARVWVTRHPAVSDLLAG